MLRDGNRDFVIGDFAVARIFCADVLGCRCKLSRNTCGGDEFLDSATSEKVLQVRNDHSVAVLKKVGLDLAHGQIEESSESSTFETTGKC